MVELSDFETKTGDMIESKVKEAGMGGHSAVLDKLTRDGVIIGYSGNWFQGRYIIDVEWNGTNRKMFTSIWL